MCLYLYSYFHLCLKEKTDLYRGNSSWWWLKRCFYARYDEKACICICVCAFFLHRHRLWNKYEVWVFVFVFVFTFISYLCLYLCLYLKEQIVRRQQQLMMVKEVFLRSIRWKLEPTRKSLTLKSFSSTAWNNYCSETRLAAGSRTNASLFEKAARKWKNKKR